MAFAAGSGFGPNYQFRNVSSNVRQMVIENLSPNLPSTNITGIIIAKQEVRIVPSKRGDGNDRYAASFTLRDSPTATINATCWGSSVFATNFNEEFHTGDVVEINNAQIQIRPTPDPSENFKPFVSSPYHLNISENHSSITHHQGDLDLFSPLFHIPTKPENDFYTLSDVIYNGQNLSGQFLNLLVAVKKVFPVRTVTTKTGKQLTRCEIKVFDQTLSSFSVVVWNEDYCAMASNWIPKETIVFIADARVKFDDFRKTMTAATTTKTILTINPSTQEGQALFTYAQSSDLSDELDSESFTSVIDLTTIKKVYKISEIEQQLQYLADLKAGEIVGIVYAFISSLDLDGPTYLITTRCSECRRRVDDVYSQCVNLDCPVGGGIEVASPKSEFNIMMSLTDHTGTVTGCVLNGVVAVNLLGQTVENFFNLRDNEKTALKWRYLLERCKVYFKLSMSIIKQTPIIQVISCSLADPNEINH